MNIRIDTDLLIPGRGEPIKDGTVIMEGDTISYAGERSDAPSGAPDRTIEVPVLLPGLWDCHIHFGTQTPDELGSVMMPSPALLGSRAVDELGRTLDGGVTSVREVGGVGIELVGEIESGRIRSPHMHSAGGIMSPTAGHADFHSIPLRAVETMSDQYRFISNVADGVPGVLKGVRMNLRRNAKVIKICTSGGVMSEVDHWSHQQFSDEEITAIVEEAARAERFVAAHAEGKAGIMAALRCGVQTIEHGDEVDDEVVDLMLEKDIILIPTMWVTRQLMSMPDEMPDYAYRKLSELAEIQEEGLAKAIAAGVRIAMGTDIFVHGPLYGTNSLEIAHLVSAGMTPLGAIEAATATSPETLGPQAPLSGQLREGYDADVIALDFNPLEDGSLWGDPDRITHVWQGGASVKQPA